MKSKLEILQSIFQKKNKNGELRVFTEAQVLQAMEEYHSQHSANTPVSGMLSSIVPTEIKIMEKAREEFYAYEDSTEQESAFVAGAKWMKKMLLDDNYR